MDIASLTVPKTINVHLSFPTVGKLYADPAKTLAVSIDVYTPAADQAVKFKQKTNHKVQKAISKDGKYVPDVDDFDIDRMVAHTAAVNNLVYQGMSITPQTIERVYRDPDMFWLTDQVRDAVNGKVADFLEA